MRFDDIRQWAEDRNLIAGSTALRQYAKLMEEQTELYSGLINEDMTEIADAVGDCIVVLTIMAATLGLSVEECIERAWQEIKDRRGRMVNGIFVKDANPSA